MGPWHIKKSVKYHIKYMHKSILGRVCFLLLLYQGHRNGLIIILGSWTLSLLVINALSYLICLIICLLTYWMGFDKPIKPFKNKPVTYIHLHITCYSTSPLPHCARVTSILNFVFIVSLVFFSLFTHIYTLALELYKKYIILYIFFREFLCFLSITVLRNQPISGFFL